jgi:hypothetical protein
MCNPTQTPIIVVKPMEIGVFWMHMAMTDTVFTAARVILLKSSGIVSMNHALAAARLKTCNVCRYRSDMNCGCGGWSAQLGAHVGVEKQWNNNGKVREKH